MPSDSNSTTNGSSCYVPLTPTAQKIGETLACCLIFVVSLVGNPIIAFIVYKTKTMRKPINYFIVNMAMSDLLFPTFLIPWQLTELYSDGFRIMISLVDQVFCKLFLFLIQVSAGVSTLSLILITVDRFGAVVFPFRSPLISSKLCPYFILSTWIIEMAAISPILFPTELFEYQRNAPCARQHKLRDGTYVFFLLVFSIYLPLFVLIILYTIIFVKLKSQRIPGEQSANAEELQARRNSHVLKMAIAIVLGFAVCWVPWSVFELLRALGSEIECSKSLYPYKRIALFMALLNCAINPCICFIFSENYRRGLKRVFHCFA